MFIINRKEDNAVLGFGDSLSYLDNGYPFLVNENIAFPIGEVDAYEVAEFPQEVEAEKWCYTEADGFYPNPNYHEPSAYDLVPTDILNAIIDEYTNELVEMGVL